VAAAALSVAAIVGLRLAPDRNSPTVPTSAAAERREDAVANAATHAGAQRDTAPVTSASFSTPAGRSRRVPLPDGSTITLMPGSTLLLRRTAAEPWGTHDRHVMLTGEASFSVRRDTLRPFIVHSGHAEVRVLGTEFVVSSYIARHGLRGRDVIGVAVREGRVGVRHLHGSEPDTTPMRILRGGDAIAMSPSGAMSSIRAADLLELHDGNLVFDQAPLGDVMREITRWYAVTATFAPDVPPALRVTTTITRGTLDDVIDQLGFTTGLRISRVGRSVHVAPAAP
jgi:ferric-dicitrate binding protein FerR (iron transport regulator)